MRAGHRLAQSPGDRMLLSTAAALPPCGARSARGWSCQGRHHRGGDPVSEPVGERKGISPCVQSREQQQREAALPCGRLGEDGQTVPGAEAEHRVDVFAPKCFNLQPRVCRVAAKGYAQRLPAAMERRALFDCSHDGTAAVRLRDDDRRPATALRRRSRGDIDQDQSVLNEAWEQQDCLVAGQCDRGAEGTERGDSRDSCDRETSRCLSA